MWRHVDVLLSTLRTLERVRVELNSLSFGRFLHAEIVAESVWLEEFIYDNRGMPTNRKEYNQAYYSAHRQERLAYNQRPGTRIKRRANCRSAGIRAKEMVLNHYGWNCVCCGEDNPSLLTLDHKDGGGRQHREEAGSTLKGYGLYRWIIKNCFPPIFQTMCWNCNCGRARNNGICPHHTFTSTDRLFRCRLRVFHDQLPV